MPKMTKTDDAESAACERTTKSLNIPVQVHPGWQQAAGKVDISLLMALSVNICSQIK